MGTDRQTNSREDGMVECQSFGSNYRPSSQSRKISIGVLIDSSANSKTTKEQATILNAEKLTPCKQNSIEDRINGEGFTPAVEKHVAPQQDTSPWVSVRSFNQNIPTSVTVHDTENTLNFPITNKTCYRSKGSKEASAARDVPFFVSETLAFTSDEGKQMNFGKATYTRKAARIDNAEHVGNLASVTEPEVVTEKALAEDKTTKTETGGCETLRMKLWEILGNVSSPNKEFRSSLPDNLGTKDLHPEQESDRKGSPAGKSRQNSDTIESDSERPDRTVSRPLTRSLTRKKVPTKMQVNKIGGTKFTRYRKECAEKSVFSFRGEWSGKLCDAVDDYVLPSKRKKIEKKSFGVETHQTCFHECKNPEERQQSENKKKSVLVAEKLTGEGKSFTTNNFSRSERNNAYVDPVTGNKKKDSDESSLKAMTQQLRDVVESPKMKDQPQNFKTRMDPVLDPQSPTFEMKSPIHSPSIGSPPKSKQGKHVDQSPAARIYSARGIQSFKSFLNSNSARHNSHSQSESSDDLGELKDSPIMKLRFSMEEGAENNSSSDEMDSESSEENSHIEDCSPEIGITMGQQISRPSKWKRNQKGFAVTGFSPASESLKGIEESNNLQAYLQQNQDDELVCAIALIAMALDRVKTKMQSATSKKSAEILRSAAEGIHLQLQSAQSQIKTDVGKVSSLSKSKRKSLETRFQEQQEQLHVIYKRFKEEIDRHLVDYKSLIEDLEEHENELKGTMDKQRAAHKRLLLQGEQAIDNQFKDAQSRIAAVHERAKEKMLQLKLVIAECVKDGLFS